MKKKSNNRQQFTTYVSTECYTKFVKKCDKNNTTPYQVLKDAVENYIKED